MVLLDWSLSIQLPGLCTAGCSWTTPLEIEAGTKVSCAVQCNINPCTVLLQMNLFTSITILLFHSPDLLALFSTVNYSNGLCFPHHAI